MSPACLQRHESRDAVGIGQAMFALAHRDRTVLIIHCGTVEAKGREHLRTVAEKICRGSKTSIVVVPYIKVTRMLIAL